MKRKNHGLVPYTTGSLEQPTPQVVSMLRISPYAGRSEGVNLKQDIVSTLNFINAERSYWQKMQLAAMKLAKTMRSDQSILVNLSGRGDKDIGTVADLSNADFYCRPSCKGQSVKGGVATIEVKK